MKVTGVLREKQLEAFVPERLTRYLMLIPIS